MPKTPTMLKPRVSSRAEAPAVTKARAAVNAAATEFETARQAMAEAGEILSHTPGNDRGRGAACAAHDRARVNYTAAGAVLGRTQAALTDAQAVVK